MSAVIDYEKCKGCAKCANHCPLDVIYMEKNKAVIRYPDECWYCGACRQDCKSGAIHFEFPPAMIGI
jgi:NAD-dependent dihydropyrimidine dehydrogenase PreA subunit